MRGISGQAVEVLLGLVEKIFLFEEIARRVAGEREFGKDGDIGAGFGCAACEGADALGIAIEIADGGVGLREGDSHAVNTIVRCGRAGHARGLLLRGNDASGDSCVWRCVVCK